MGREARGSGVPDRGLVFVVEHDASSAREMAALLESEGYNVAITATGDGVPDAVTRAEPNLILLDADLPDKNSIELLDELKRGEQTRDVPVIVLISADASDGPPPGLESGDDLIIRPIDAREDLARIERQVTVSKVRKALRESEAEFRSVMESAIDAIISADADGKIRSWNSAATALFGFSESEVIGRPIEIIIPERYHEPHQVGIHRVSSGGETHVIGTTVELAAVRNDGFEFPVELSLATWFLDEKRYYTGIIRDITERKQAEQKFRSVTESAVDAIISADHVGEIISWNRAASDILGYDEEEAIGQRLEFIIPERFHEAHRNGMARFMETGEPKVIGNTVELAARTKSGEEVPIELSLSTWTVHEDRYFTGIIRDIGERKTAEQALRQSEQALRERTGELKRKNDALEETLNRLNEANDQLMIQEKMASLGRLSAGMAHELNNPAASVQRGAEQLQTALADGQQVQMKMVTLKLNDQQIDHLTVLDQVAQEATRKPPRLDALLRLDREEIIERWLGDRNLAVDALVSSSLVAVDYGTDELDDLAEIYPEPMLAVVLDWLSYTHTMYSLVSDIGLGTDRIADLVKALKTYTYMDQVGAQAVDVREGLDNTLIILRNRLKRGVNVIREYSEDLPEINAYAGELNQVWTNLIDNAIDAMDGEGTLKVRARQEDDWIVVEIEDDGPGILEENQSKLFDPFFTTKGPGEGAGLGLKITRNLVVQKHHGELSVESHPGRTCFAVRLPMDLAADE